MRKSNHCIDIIADYRESKSKVIASLKEFETVTVHVRRLRLGDYQVDKRLVVERKTYKDFSVSIIDGRLFMQLIRLANSNWSGILILEGTTSEIAGIGLTRETLQGALITTSLILGVAVLPSTDSVETARLIVYAARQLDLKFRGGVYRHGYRPKGKRKLQLFILQGLPGVGSERAEGLLNVFGSVKSVMMASNKELQEVKGIGKKIADKIKWVIS